MSLILLPTVESFGNNDITTLAAPVGDSDTLISVATVSGFPTDGQFRLLIDVELVLVTGYDSVANQFQVVRGAEGTTPTTHLMDAQVACVLTKGSLQTLGSNTKPGPLFIYRDSEPNPSGNLHATFDDAYAAAKALPVPSTIIIDDTLSQCSTGNATNYGAQYSSVVGSTATITGLLNMTPAVVGQNLNLETEGPAGNNGIFPVIAYLSPTSVQITNAAATVALRSYYDWYLLDGTAASIESVSGANGTAASITAFATPLATVSGLANMTAAMVGQTLVLNNVLQGMAATITAFDGTLVTLSGLTNMSPVLVGQNLSLNFIPNGSNASITAFDGTNATVVGLTGMSAAFVGQSFNLSGSVYGGNNGSFVISAYLSPTSVQITNPSAVSPDPGPLTWGTQDPNNGVFPITTYLSPTSVQITNSSAVFPDPSDFAWSTTDPNSGSWPIAAYLSPTSVQITNASAVSPDPGPFFWYVLGAANTCALVAGVVNASPAMVGQTLTFAGMGDPGNVGTFTVLAFVPPASVWISNPNAVAGDSGELNFTGTSAFISSVVPNTNGGQEVISGLTGITPALVGQAINVTNAFYAGPEPAPDNNGDQAILGYVSPTALVILNDPYANACAAPDYGVGGTSGSPTINWEIQLYVHVVAVQNFEMVMGLSGITPDVVGNVLTIQNANNGSNGGVWEIAGYISPTSVLLNNTNATPDTNNGTLGWYVGTNYDLSQITLASIPSNPSNPEFFIYDGATFNQGIAKISDIDVYTEFNYQYYLGTFLRSGEPVWAITGTGEFLVDNVGFIYDLSQVVSFSPTLTMTGNSYVNQLVNFGTNQDAGISVYFFEAAYADSDFAQGTAGNVGFYAYTALAEVFPTTISGFTGSFNVNYISQAVTLQPFASGSLPTHVENDPIQVGTMFFSTDSSQAYWWNGGTWVTYATPPSVAITGTPSVGYVPTATSGTTATWQAPTYRHPAYVQGYTINQASNLGVGDHVTFNVDGFSLGTDITLDTTSPYTSTLGQPSVGRITLAPGHSYRLIGGLVQVTGSGNLFYQWANASSGGTIGIGARVQATGDTDAPAECVALITVSGSPLLVELQIEFNSGVTSLGENAAAQLYPWFTAEEIA